MSTMLLLWQVLHEAMTHFGSMHLLRSGPLRRSNITEQQKYDFTVPFQADKDAAEDWTAAQSKTPTLEKGAQAGERAPEPRDCQSCAATSTACEEAPISTAEGLRITTCPLKQLSCTHQV